MSRIRIFALVLAVTIAMPATASANPWASMSSPSASLAAAPCFVDNPPYAATATDTTTVPGGWSNTAVNVTLTGTGQQGFEWALECDTIQTTGSTMISGDGSHIFSHRAQESGTGDWTPWIDDTVNIDTTAPVNATAASSSWRQGPVNVPLSISDATSPVHGEWKVDTDPSYAVSNTATVTGTGTHTLHTSAVDAAGNRHDQMHTVRVDDTVPVDTSVVPVGWQTDKATITLSGTDTGDQSGVARVIYQLDGNVGVPVSNNTIMEITANGHHTLRINVVDNAGNQSGWTDYDVFVDNQGPVDNTVVPSGWVTTPSVDVSITGTDTLGSGVVLIEWELTEDLRSGTVNGAGPVSITVTGEGEHTLRTRFTDGDGHSSGWKVQKIRIDTVLPDDTTNVTSAWLPRSTYDVTVRGTDPSPGSSVGRIEYVLDGVAGDVGGNTGVITVAGSGEHVLQTRVVDVAGNTTGWVSRAVRLDPDSPVNTTPLAPSGWRQTAYGVKLNGTDVNSGVAQLEWKVNGGAPSLGGLEATNAYVSGDGIHTLSTRVKDAAGNFSAWRDEAVRIDSVKPTDTTTVAATVPNGRKITLTGTDALSGLSGSVEWTLDNGAVKTASQATIVGAGPHVLKTRVQDNAGNWSDWKSANVTVDPTLPQEDSDAPIDNTTVPTGWQTGPVTVTVTADDNGGTGVRGVDYQIPGRAIVSGPNGLTVTIAEDGVYTIKTRGRDDAGNVGVWREHELKIDQTLPVDTSDLPVEWTKNRDIVFSATDATSGVTQIQYKINNGAPVTINGDHATVTLPGDGTFTVSRQVTDAAGQQTGWTTSTVKVDTIIPVLSSAAAPTAWQTATLALNITGTDIGGGVDHAEWRIGAGGAINTGTPTAVSNDGTQVLETRVVDKAGNPSAWRTEVVRIDRTAPTNTTPAPAAAWRKTNFATTVTGTDAASGVLRVEWKLDNAASATTSPAVSIGQEGSYKLYTRVLDNAGNASDWREDVVGIDKTAPTLAVDCGAATWRKGSATCNVSASGGSSGLSALTGSRGETPVDVSGGVYTVTAEGSSTVTFRAVDGAGNEVTAKGLVKVDASAPAATVTCAPDSKSLNYLCRAGGTDTLSGVASLTWSLDGKAATPIAAGTTFTVAKGKVVVTAADGAGNTGASSPVTLAARHGDAAGGETGTTTTITPRSTSQAVLLKGKASASARLVGQLALAATPSGTTVDLRPLALGKGTFQIVLKVTVGKKTKTTTKTQTTVKGYSKRVTVKAAAGADVKVALTVKRKSGKRWVAHASASAKLG